MEGSTNIRGSSQTFIRLPDPLGLQNTNSGQATNAIAQNAFSKQEVQCPTTVMVMKNRNSFLCLERSHIEAFSPEIEAKLPPMSNPDGSRKHPEDESSDVQKGVLMYDDKDELKFISLERLKEGWNRYRWNACFLSRNNESDLFNKVCRVLSPDRPLRPGYKIVGVVDNQSRDDNRLEALLINEFKLKIPPNYFNPTIPVSVPTNSKEEEEEDHDLSEAAEILEGLNQRPGNKWTEEEIDTGSVSNPLGLQNITGPQGALAPTTVLCLKWHDSTLFVKSSFAEVVSPGIGTLLPEDSKKLVAREEKREGPGAEENYVIVDSMKYGLRLVEVNKLMSAWDSERLPHTSFLSSGNRPDLFNNVYRTLFTPKDPLAPVLNVVGVLDPRSLTSNRLEAIIINEFHLIVPRNYLGLTEPRTPKRHREIGEPKGSPTKRSRPDDEPKSSK